MNIIFTTQDMGAAFKAERKALKKTQQWVADQMGRSRKAVVDLEAGRNVTVDTLIAALTTLGKRLDIVDARLESEQLKALLENDDDEA